MRRRGNGPWLALFIVGQLALAAAGWVTDRPWFGWQMFSRLGLPPRVLVSSRPERWDTIPLFRHLGFPRSDLRYPPDLGREVCRVVPGAQVVRVIPEDGPWAETRCE